MAAAAFAASQRTFRGLRSAKLTVQNRHLPNGIAARDVHGSCDVLRQVASALGSQWLPRRLVMTRDRLYFCKSADHGDVVLMDSILLHEIEELRALNSDHADVGAANRRLSTHSLISVDKDPFQLQEDDKDPKRVLAITTASGLHGPGRQAVVYFADENERDVTLGALRRLVSEAKEEEAQRANPGLFRRLQRQALRVYESWQLQSAAIFIIILSFLVSIMQAQMRLDPADVCGPYSAETDCQTYRIFWWIETICTMCFTGETLLALFALGAHNFLGSKSNIFDAAVVSLCLASMAFEQIPNMGAVRLLRLVRVVRVFTILGRVKSLRIILTALTNSAVPVAFVFLLLFLVLAVFSLLATELFRDMDPVNFGDLEKTAFSLVQVSSGDSWASSIARGLTERNPDVPAWSVHVFFVLFFMLVGMVLMNIVVAILLDEFLGTVAREKAEEHRQTGTTSSSVISGVSSAQALDPFLAGLVTFTTEEGLLSKIHEIYEAMDIDQSGALSREEFNAGLKLFSLGEQVQVSQEEWQVISEEGTLLNADGEIGPSGFEAMVLTQLRAFTNRKLVLVMNQLDTDENEDNKQHIIVLALKMILNYVNQLQKSVAEVQTAVDPEGSRETARMKRSRMQVIMSLKKLPMRRAFASWAAAIDHGGPCNELDVLTEVANSVHNLHGPGTMGFDAFVSTIRQCNKLKIANPVRHVRRIFKQLDLDDLGCIKKADLHSRIEELEYNMSDRDLMLRRLDTLEGKLNSLQTGLATRVDALADAVAEKVMAGLRGNDDIFLKRSPARGRSVTSAAMGNVCSPSPTEPSQVNFTPQLGLELAVRWERPVELPSISAEGSESDMPMLTLGNTRQISKPQNGN